MIRILLPNGLTHSYKLARFIFYEDGRIELFADRSRTEWICSVAVPSGIIVENKRYLEQNDARSKHIAQLEKKIRLLERKRRRKGKR